MPGMDDSRLYLPETVRAIDAAAIEQCGIAAFELMRRAANAAYQELRRRWPEARHLLVLAGGGNNGGDGIELARLAMLDGRRVELVLLADPAQLRGAAAEAWSAFEAAGGTRCQVAHVDAADVIVDALFGIGLSRAIDGEAADWVARVNRGKRPVLALDIPSGLDACTGMPLGAALGADATITFIARKLGLYQGSAAACVGDVVFADCDVPAGAFADAAAAARLLTDEDLHAAWPARGADMHKGHFGHLVIVGGQPGMPGAALMAARAALRSGVGLVTVITHPDHAAMLPLVQAELMVKVADDAAPLREWLEPASAIVCGPGLGQSDWSRSLLETVLEHAGSRPLILDADALNLIAETPRPLPPQAVITPHPGEAARLLGCSTAALQSDRLAAAQALLDRWACTTVLKGAGTWVVAPDALPAFCPAGNPGMGVGGMGDVLSGMIGGTAAGRSPLGDAVRGAVLAHARAGDVAAAQYGQAGLLPSDLIDTLCKVLPRP